MKCTQERCASGGEMEGNLGREWGEVFMQATWGGNGVLRWRVLHEQGQGPEGAIGGKAKRFDLLSASCGEPPQGTQSAK